MVHVKSHFGISLLSPCWAFCGFTHVGGYVSLTWLAFDNTQLSLASSVFSHHIIFNLLSTSLPESMHQAKLCVTQHLSYRWGRLTASPCSTSGFDKLCNPKSRHRFMPEAVPSSRASSPGSDQEVYEDSSSMKHDARELLKTIQRSISSLVTSLLDIQTHLTPGKRSSEWGTYLRFLCVPPETPVEVEEENRYNLRRRSVPSITRSQSKMRRPGRLYCD
jgi:hypothetical protein